MPNYENCSLNLLNQRRNSKISHPLPHQLLPPHTFPLPRLTNRLLHHLVPQIPEEHHKRGDEKLAAHRFPSGVEAEERRAPLPRRERNGAVFNDIHTPPPHNQPPSFDSATPPASK